MIIAQAETAVSCLACCTTSQKPHQEEHLLKKEVRKRTNHKPGVDISLKNGVKLTKNKHKWNHNYWSSVTYFEIQYFSDTNCYKVIEASESKRYKILTLRDSIFVISKHFLLIKQSVDWTDASNYFLIIFLGWLITNKIDKMGLEKKGEKPAVMSYEICDDQPVCYYGDDERSATELSSK